MSTQINTPSIGFVTGQSATDAFGRQRVSGTGSRLDVEFIYNKQPDFFDEITNNGTVTHNGATRDLTLALDDAADGSYATMRSHPAPYTPGNSQLIDITGVLNLAGLASPVAEVFLRSSISGSVTEETVEQSAWSNLKDSVDWSDSHIFSIDFQSLKVGRIRYALVTGGEIKYVAEINNDNVRDSGYWQVPSQGAYWRIYNDATYSYMEVGYGDEANAVGFRVKVPVNASATMKAICCTVKSEAGLGLQELSGIPRSADTGITPVTVSTTLVPILSIRPKSTFLTYPNLNVIVPELFGIQTTEAIKIAIIHNGTLTGPSWVDADATESAVEYDVSASAIANGHVIFSDYIYAVSTGAAAGRVTANNAGLLGKTVLWDRKGAETGVLTIAAIRTGGADSSVFANLQWKEIR